MPEAPTNLTIDGGGIEPPPPVSEYRGIPDPNEALGFDIRADYVATETVTGSQGRATVGCTGTAQQPCLIDASGATFTHLTVTGSYMILQGGTVNAPADRGAWLRVSCSYCVIRDAEVIGPQRDVSHSSAVSMNSFSVWLRGSIHNFGDIGPNAREQDFHGFKVMSDDVWILDAEVYEMSGDSVQVGDASRGSASRVYIGGGYFHHNRENGVDIKDSNDIVVSGVFMEGFRSTNSDPGSAVVVHDDAFDALIYDNIIIDAPVGIVSSGARGHVINKNRISVSRTGIELRNTQNLTVTENVIEAPTCVNNQSGTSGDIQTGCN
jgi:hypothetical protein